MGYAQRAFIVGLIRTFLPKPLQEPALKLLPMIRKVVFFGSRRYCPVCRSHVRLFRAYGPDKRSDACCPVCGSPERLRFMWLFLDHRKDLFESQHIKLLHFAPERVFQDRYRQMPAVEYVSADIDPARAMVQMDITDIQYPDNTFDIIHCSHVLEHVPDDILAMRQVCRVLKHGGCAIIAVPITAKETFEDPSATTPAERERIYGLHDHLRRYGPDVEQRLNKAGFDVQCVRPQDFIDAEDIARMRIENARIFLCRKP
jgi:SAM-dependent methyltransferase